MAVVSVTDARALVFAPYGHGGVHTATTLEVAQRLADDGYAITFVRCRGVLAACDYRNSVEARRRMCHLCRSGQRRMPGAISGASVGVTWLPPLLDHDPRIPRRFDDVASLVELRIGEFDLGEAVYSNLASAWWFNTPSPDFGDPDVQRDAGRLARSSLHVYESVLRMLRDERPDVVVVFNGRVAIMRAVLRACQEAGVKCLVHERGGDLTRFSLTENAMPHSREALARSLEATRCRFGPAERAAIAARFYDERRAGVVRNWRSFTDGQERGSAPVVEAGRRLVVVFTSTQTEFVGLGPEWHGMYASQVDGIVALASGIACLPDRPAVVIRMHPNTSATSEIAAVVGACRSLPATTVLEPSSPVDSYALVDAASCVITFGSTIGIEAAYSERPSILAAPAAYSGLGSVYEPANHEELVALVADAALPALPSDGAVLYGCHVATAGEEFRFAAEPSLGGRALFREARVNGGLVPIVCGALDRAARYRRRLAGRSSRPAPS